MDIWTAAETEKKSGRGRARGNDGVVYGVKKLRELILELAVRGKLVPQDSNDEPASKLLERIKTEKVKLISEGKLKNQKPLPSIGVYEKSVDIPSSWTWARLENVVTQVTDGEHLSPKKSNSGVKLLTAKHIRDKGVTTEDPQYVSEKDAQKFLKRCNPELGDIFICSRGTIGRSCVNDLDEIFCLMGSVILLKKSNESSSFYLNCFIKSSTGQLFIRGVTKGMAVNALYLKDVKLCPVPIPPIQEQHRIVAKVDELMALCDQLEQQHSNAQAAHETLVNELLATLTQSQNAADFNDNWQRIYAHFDVLFTTEASVDALKQTLLQLAVMGKLVSQDPNDEAASELLKRIQAEKAKLVAAGKLKKQKPLEPISEDEKPFALPINWNWVRLQEISEYIQRGKGPKYSDSGKVRVVSQKCIQWSGFDLKAARYVDDMSLDAYQEQRFLKSNDLLWNSTGTGTVGRINLITGIGKRVLVADSHVTIIRTLLANAGFICKYISSSDIQKRIEPGNESTLVSGTTKQVELNTSTVLNLLVPLPPLEEQHLIVVKVNAMIALCDQLKTRIQQAKQQQKTIADVLVEIAAGTPKSTKDIINITDTNAMKIITSLIIGSNAEFDNSAKLANIIKSAGGELEAKHVWQKSKLELKDFYKQLKLEIDAGYILKPSVAKLQEA